MATDAVPLRDDLGKLVLRLTLGGLLLFHGVAKLRHGIGWMGEPLAAFGLPMVVGYGTYIAEVACPFLLFLGVMSRAAALIIAFDLFMAVLVVRRDGVFQVSQMGGSWAIEIEAFFFLAAVAVFLLGSGRLAMRPSKGMLD
jgi:putative oxidoreductase